MSLVFGACLLAAACGDDDSGKTSAAPGRGGTSSGGSTGSGGDAGDSSSAGQQGEAGSPSASGAYFSSGSRLSVRQYQAGDMPPVFLSFYDTELETECTFLDVDGTLRCVPTAGGYTITRAEFFADADCSEPVATRNTECPDGGEWMVEYESLGQFCDGTLPHVFRVVPLEIGDPLYVDDGGGCTEQGEVDDTLLWYRVEPEMPPEELVAAEKVVDDSDGRLSVRRIVADDGAEYVEGAYDTEAPGLCRIFDLEDIEVCVPESGYHSMGYRNQDADCMEPLSLEACTPPLYLWEGVGSDRTFYHAGPEYTGDVYGGIGTCELVENLPEIGGAFYEVGDVVDPEEEFAVLEPVRQGSGRLLREVFADSEGTPILPSQRIYDSELEVYCSVQRDADGNAFCLPEEVPTQAGTNPYFADAECTQRLAHCHDHDCPYDVAVQLDEDIQCVSDFNEVLALGDEFTGDEFYIQYPPDPECYLLQTIDFGTLRYVEGPGTLDAFAEVELVTE